MHFYRVPELIGSRVDPLFLEKDLSALEKHAALILAAVLSQLGTMQAMDRLILEDEDREALSSFLAVQFLRSAEQREILALFATVHGGYKEPPSPEERINLHARMLCSGGLVEDLTERLYSSIWIFARNSSKTPPWTSDNPAAFKTGDNRMWLKAPGIFAEGSYLVFPLTPQYVLYCKEPKYWARLKHADSCLSPVELSDEMVAHENAGQVFMATRHVVSPDSNFAWANDFAETIGTEYVWPPRGPFRCPRRCYQRSRGAC